MSSRVADVIEALQGANSANQFARAERRARALSPHDQLLVVNAYRAARARIQGGRL